MKIKSIDSLSIAECCEQLNLRREDLPEALQELNAFTEREQLLIDRLDRLLDEDKTAFELCNSIEEYEEYLSTWSDGLYHDVANQRIAQLKAEAEEFAFYANNKDNISGCEAYLQKYPKGKFVEEVQSVLAQKNKSIKTRNTIIFLFLLIAMGILIYSNYVSVSYISVEDKAELNNEGSKISLNISTDASSSAISVISSEEWIDCYVSGKTLYIFGTPNLEEEREATITITAYSSFFGNKLSERKQTTITVSQKTGYATYLSVSNDEIYFPADGGTETVTVNTDGIWGIGTSTYSWIELSRSGNTITLDIESYSGSEDRDAHFTIKSGNLERRINILQAAKSASYLNPSQTNISVSHTGGTRTITVSADGAWEIGTNTASWIELSRSGNTITLDIESYSGSEDRDDWFTVKSGNLEERINILQSGDDTPKAEINRVWVEHNISRTGYNNVFNPYWGWQQVPYTYNVMRIHVDFDVKNMKGETVWVCAFFYDEDGNEMTTSNNRFRAPNGQVTVQNTGYSTYKHSNWSDYVLEIPNSVMKKGANKFCIQILGRGNALSISDYEHFTLN